MRLLAVTNTIPRFMGGGGDTRVINLLNHLAEQCEVHFLPIPHNGYSRQQIQDFTALCPAVRVLEYNEVSSLAPPALPAPSLSKAVIKRLLHMRPTEYPYRAQWTPDHLRIVQRVLTRAMHNTPYDVIHIEQSELASWSSFTERPNTCVVDYHDVVTTQLRSLSHLSPSALRKLEVMMELQKFRRYERIWAAQLGLCLVVSDQERDRLRRIQPKARIEVIPNGVDTSYFHPSSIPSNPERLVFTGSMSHMPNVDAVIFFCEKILPLVQAYHPDVSLDIVGTNPLPRVQALARQHRNVRVTGAVEDVRPYIWDAAVYIAPIRTGGGTRLKILEALACGKAVVATAFACEGLDLRDGTHVLLRDAAEDSAKAIIDLIENPQHAYCLGTAGWDFVVKHYDWSCIGTMLFGEYCRLSEAAHRVDPRR